MKKSCYRFFSGFGYKLFTFTLWAEDFIKFHGNGEMFYRDLIKTSGFCSTFQSSSVFVNGKRIVKVCVYPIDDTAHYDPDKILSGSEFLNVWEPLYMGRRVFLGLEEEYDD